MTVNLDVDSKAQYHRKTPKKNV